VPRTRLFERDIDSELEQRSPVGDSHIYPNIVLAKGVWTLKTMKRYGLVHFEKDPDRRVSSLF
jgi:hypothetical protein